jgi:hypothetical protein
MANKVIPAFSRKLRPRSEMILVGSALAVMAATLLLSLTVTVPVYFKFKQMAGTKVTFSSSGFDSFLRAYSALLLIAFPGIAVVCGYSAWVVFKNFKRITDNKPEGFETTSKGASGAQW